jgi:hypothetical protein
MVDVYRDSEGEPVEVEEEPPTESETEQTEVRNG